MMETKFTKAPWKAVINKEGTSPHFITNESGQSRIADVQLDVPEIETIANAKVIAAAPELLQGCIEALKELKFHNWQNTNTYLQIEQAIKKATQ